MQLIVRNFEHALIQGIFINLNFRSFFRVHYSHVSSITYYNRFCRIQRKNEINSHINRHYKLIDNSLHLHRQEYRATILSPTSDELNLYISAQASGSIRVKITEKVHRWQV